MWTDDIETPAYVYDLAEVRRCYERLAESLPRPSTVYYSLKANPHPALVAELHAAGAHAEVCSPGELATALDAGVPADRVLYTGPGKRAADLWAALKQGVRAFSVDSPVGLDDLDRAAAELGVEVDALLRVNGDRATAGQRLTMTGVASQFGADAAWVEADPAAFGRRPRVNVTGLHLYAGSNIDGEDQLVAQFDAAIGTATRLRSVLRTAFATLDLGGGFGAPYARAGDLPAYPTLAGRVAAALDADFPGWRSGAPDIVFESGRHLVATCGRLLVRVLDTKVSHGRRVVVLESGINHLGGMSGLRRLPPLVPDLVVAAEGEVWTDVLVTGPLCTPLDTWSRGATTPAWAPGDLLAVPNVGAYGLSASLLAFLGHPAPLEVVVDGDRVVGADRLRLIREPVTVAKES